MVDISMLLFAGSVGLFTTAKRSEVLRQLQCEYISNAREMWLTGDQDPRLFLSSW